MGFFDNIRAGSSGQDGADPEYVVGKSLQFVRDNKTMMRRSNTSDGSRRKFTLSFWFKLNVFRTTSEVNYNEFLFSAGGTGGFHGSLQVNILANGRLSIFEYDDNAYAKIDVATRRVFRDPNAWYHVVIAVDTTQSTDTDRLKIYINGVNTTNLIGKNQASLIWPPLNWQSVASKSGKKQTWGAGIPHLTGVSNYSDIYMAEIHFSDGYQYDASNFGEFDSNNYWHPKEFTDNYGSEGYKLNFADATGNTAAKIGKDTSGNGNNFTPDNFEMDSSNRYFSSSLDSPSQNYATLNALQYPGDTKLNYGNLLLTGYNFARIQAASRFVNSGKYYCEVELIGSTGYRIELGIVRDDFNLTGNLGDEAMAYGYRSDNGKIVNNSVVSGYGASFSVGDIIGIALDMDNGQLIFYKNGSSQGLAATGLTGMWTFAACCYGNNAKALFNFGARSFTHNIPANHFRLFEERIPTPIIAKPRDHVDALIWTGNGSTKNVTGLLFKPDWVWIKNRNSDYSVYNTDHALFDSLRGPGKYISTNNTNVEKTASDTLTSFDSNGFTLGANAGASSNTNPSASVNLSNASHVAWCWYTNEKDTKTYILKKVNVGGNKYRFRNSTDTANFNEDNVTLQLSEEGTFTFDMSSNSMDGHPMLLSATPDGTHNSGTVYEVGVVYLLNGQVQVNRAAWLVGYENASTRSIVFTPPTNAPTLYYYCHHHTGMGGAIDTLSGKGCSNFDGTIKSKVSANTLAGFSIIEYQGDGTNSDKSIGHGLGVKPDAWWIRTLDNNSNADDIYHNKLGYDDLTSYTNTGNSTTYAQPNTDVIKIKGQNQNKSTFKYICYAFSGVLGFSKFGAYQGTGDDGDEGPFIPLGFRPAIIWIKNTGYTSADWFIYDHTRALDENTLNRALIPSEDFMESSSSTRLVDFTSSGLKIRGGTSEINQAYKKFIYFAFAEVPLKYGRAN